MHVSVMLHECLEHLALKPGGVYADVTSGLGGHTGAIARQLASYGKAGLVIACDRDAESLEKARAATADVAERIVFRQARFSELKDVLKEAPLDGILADLGVSRYQLTDGERGFSFQSDGPLDMRMSRGEDSHGDRGGQRTAADIVNYESEKELANLIYRLGEERRSRQIARAIVRARPIQSTGHLAKVIEGAVPRANPRIHPATQTFQALRIEINNELEEIESLMEQIPVLVKPGGRAVILTFHSLEDRIVKQAFQAMARQGQARLLTRHVVRPTEEEIRINPPSRSAKLRALELIER